jgi:hypothetical protein
MAKNDGGVNFIRHLLSISEKFIDDQRLSPLHISLYYALFQSWNLSKFRNPISISRDELMRASKIGSANTYTKCLKELDAWKYIKYLPSHNPYKGSQIYLYNFNKTTDNGIDISSDKSSNKTGGKTPEKVVIPSLNSINNTNESNSLNEHESTRKKNSRKFIAAGGNRSKEKKVAQKKENAIARKSEGTPTLLKVKKYFAGRKWPDIEAEKFYNYFQSNGWLVGGKTAMKDWKAAANNWMLNTESFNKNGSNAKPSAGKLHTSAAKDYTEPL